MGPFSFVNTVNQKPTPECGLYLTIPDEPLTHVLVERLRKACRAINESVYQKNLHVFEYGRHNAAMSEHDVNALGEFIQSQGMVFLVHERHAGCAYVDGIITVEPQAIAAAAASQDDEKITLYTAEKLSRAEAAFVLDQGLDAIGFPFIGGGDKADALALVAWWATQTDKPCFIKNTHGMISTQELVHAGVTFIDASPALQPDADASAHIAALLAEIEESIEGRKLN